MPVAMVASAAIDWFNFKQQQKTRVDFFLAFFGCRYHLLYPNQISCFQCTPKWRNRRLIVLNGRICARHTHTHKLGRICGRYALLYPFFLCSIERSLLVGLLCSTLNSLYRRDSSQIKPYDVKMKALLQSLFQLLMFMTFCISFAFDSKWIISFSIWFR